MSELILSSIPKDELISQIASAVIRTIRQELKDQAAQPDEKKLTPDEASAFLKVSKPTLNKYEKNGLITRQTIGRRVYYLQSELLAAGTKPIKS